MNTNARLSPPRHRRGPPLANLRLLAPLLAIALLAVSAPQAFADACKGCAAPTLTDLKGEPGFRLPTRYGFFGTPYRDYYLLDRGECVSKPTGLPDIQRLRTWLALRGQGEVWDCPHSQSTDKITVTSSQSDSTAWSFSSTVGLELSAPGAKVKAQVQQGRTTGVTITEVTTISKTITPGWCHRITWKAYFEVGLFRATAMFTHEQRWRWWIKNVTTGAAVHASGDYWMACGSSTITLDRHAPISGYFDLSQRGCSDDLCRYVLAKHLGMFPTPPPHLSGGTDDPGNNPGDGTTDPTDEDGTPEPSTSDPDGDDPDSDDPDSDDPDENDPDDSDPDDDNRTEPQLSSGEMGEPPSGPLPNPLGNG